LAQTKLLQTRGTNTNSQREVEKLGREFMQNLGLLNPTKPTKIGFWKRQFQVQGNSKQKVYDWIFGVILPVICFVFDPIVFKGNAWGVAVFGNYKPFAYLLSFVSIMAMAAWLIWGAKLKWLNGFLAGLFFIGGLISLGIGIVLIPFSLMGLIIMVGILGFTPLFTALVFLRNAFRAVQSSKTILEESVLIYSVAFGSIFSFVVPWVINVEIVKSLENIEKGDAQIVRAEAEKLKYVKPLVNFDNLALIYQRTSFENRQTDKMKAIAEVYNQLTGENVENKSRVLMD
jgi:hypothetical protein